MLKPQCTQQTLRKVSDEAPSAGEWLLNEMALRARKLRSIANLMALVILGSGLNNFFLNTYLLSLSNNCSLESLRESRRRRAKGTRLLRQIAAGGGKTQEMQIIRPKAPRFWCN